MSGDDFNMERLAIAGRVVERLQAELGEHLLAAAVYGSVAHEDAGAESDVELAVVTDATVQYADVYCFEQGILVEYTLVPEARMLAALTTGDIARIILAVERAWMETQPWGKPE